MLEVKNIGQNTIVHYVLVIKSVGFTRQQQELNVTFPTRYTD